MTEWKDDDEFTTTYGTLKRALAEAVEAERERIVALLEAERNRIAETISLPLGFDSGDAFIDAQIITGLIELIETSK